MFHRDQAAIIRVLPNRKSWARRTPSVHRFPVSALTDFNPFQEIKNQVFDRVGHRASGSQL
jgi:hypothetical protein